MSTSTREDKQHASKFAVVLQGGSPDAAPRPAKRKRRVPRWIFVGAALATLSVLVMFTLGGSLLSPAAPAGTFLTEKARLSDLVVSIAEDGTLESAHNKDVKCDVQGGSTILWIIKDGTDVKKGEELVRLDSSGIQEKIDLQQITYEKAKALMIEAEKNFESAQISVQEYIEGTYVQNLQTLKVAATVAKENLESARNTLQFTNRMHRKGYVTTLQRDAQAFAVQRATLDLEVAETAIEVLEKFTKAKTLVGLESVRDSSEAKMASEKAAFKLEEDRLKKLQAELEKCVIKAPDDGMVVYANEQQERRSGSSSTSLVEEGAMMRERQTMIRLPDLSHMQVKCTVHESKVDSLARGMRARISVQGKEFQGIVTSIANQPEPGNWFSGSVKEYAAIVAIESDPHGLRPGMTSAVEILVANLQNVLSVPVQSVVEKKGKFYCWVSNGAGAERREVQLGMGNNTRIEVKSGISEGDEVLLNPRISVDEASEEEHSEDAVDVKKKFGGDKPANMPAIDTGRRDTGKGKGRGGMDLMAADANKDGKVSEDEAPEAIKGEIFGRIDSNGDKFLDAKEIAEAKRKQQERAKQRQGSGDGPPGA